MCNKSFGRIFARFFSLIMKENFTLIFEKQPIIVEDVKGKLPTNCIYPIHSADDAKKYQFEKATLLKQKCYFDHYQIDSFELDTKTPFRIQYKLSERQIFISFIFHNDISFTAQGDIPMLVAKELTHYISYEDIGTFGVNCSPGNTVLLVVSVNPHWLLKAVADYPLLTEAVRGLLENGSPFEILPHFKIDKKIKEWIFQVRNFTHENRFARDSFIATHLAMGLGNYEKSLAQTDTGKIYQIKLYIEREFADPNLELRPIISSFGFSERTAMRKFKAIYGMSMRTFKKNYRISVACNLMQKEKIPAAKIIQKVGYLNTNSFYKALREFQTDKK